ncbi:TetR/AcrR family transcriptional regulator [Isoptericola croceus]|uniref:TetR/AcrR family transcriptional regulator n=1 Tax=Isoptericola croceus TaxID=3031406 RepID=UPI0027BA0801|nr:TetR/AcrR family transcriptional regulator [Isoptericola croceus]
MRQMVESASTDGRRARGDRTRRAVLDQAVQAASLDGLGGLTFGSLAGVAPVNKSGIAGLFGSKERLQLAVVEHARTLFVDAVLAPARAAPPGLRRLWALVGSWVDYSRSRVFAGGCFFRTAEIELDGQDGPVRDAVVAAHQEWEGYLRHHVELAAAAGELAADVDAEQLVFEITALLGGANDRSLLLDDDAVYGRASAAVRAVLVARGADPAELA